MPVKASRVQHYRRGALQSKLADMVISDDLLPVSVILVRCGIPTSSASARSGACETRSSPSTTPRASVLREAEPVRLCLLAWKRHPIAPGSMKGWDSWRGVQWPDTWAA